MTVPENESSGPDSGSVARFGFDETTQRSDRITRENTLEAVSSDSMHLVFGRRAMACLFQILLHPDRNRDATAACEALDRISYIEKVLSVYLEDSELSRLNREAAQRAVNVSETVWYVLKLAERIHRETFGAFDMTSTSLSKAWGFFRREGRMPKEQDIQTALQRCGFDFVELDEPTRKVRFLRDGIELNSGGIGKGYALDSAAAVLQRHGVTDALLHGGKSSILAIGDQSRGDRSGRTSHPGWRIAVRHPYRDELLLGDLVLKNKALGTSGAANQFFYFQGKRFGHVIDPRSGWPASNWLSVTVVAEDAGSADAIATGLFVADQQEIDDFSEKNTGIGVLAIRKATGLAGDEVLTWNLSETTWQEKRNRS